MRCLAIGLQINCVNQVEYCGFRLGSADFVRAALACQIIRHNCKQGRNCGFFSVEVKRTQIINRLIAMESGISVFELRDPRWLSDDEMNRIGLAAQEIAKWPLQIEDAPSLDIREVSAIARLFISRCAEINIVDYLQKIKAPGKDRFEKVTNIANGLWELGRATGVPVIALSQLRGFSSAEAPNLL